MLKLVGASPEFVGTAVIAPGYAEMLMSELYPLTQLTVSSLETVSMPSVPVIDWPKVSWYSGEAASQKQ
jgi:hypothetical protein